MITVDKFNVRILRKGDKYGRDFCLTHDEDKPLVEFYDGRYPHCEYGQFVTRYYVSTILGTDKWGRGAGGLILDGGIPAWTVSAEDMDTVREYLRTETDLHVLKEGYVSVVPTHFDLTAYAHLNHFKSWEQ